MSPWRVILAVVFPPFAVLDKGCGVTAIVFLLTLAGWIPGVLAALMINIMSPTSNNAGQRQFVDIPSYHRAQMVYEKPKRKGAYIRLADGEVAEVVDDDVRLPDIEIRKHSQN